MNLTNFTRAAFAVLATIVGLILALGLNVVLAMSNYLALEYSLEMLGLDTAPLGSNKLLGFLFASLCPQASLTNLVAACLAGVVAVGFYVFIRLLLQMLDHFKQIRLHRKAGNQAEVEGYRWLIAENLMYLSLFVLPIVGFSVWDVELFRFRSVIGAAQAPDAQTAVTLATWSTVVRESSDVYAITLAKVGMWGYLSVNVMACLLLEWVLSRVRDRFVALMSIVEGWFQTDEQEGKNRQAQVPNAPEEISDYSGDVSATPSVPVEHSEPVTPTRPKLAPDAPVEPIPEAEPQNEKLRPAAPRVELRRVIGGEPDERVATDQALREPARYHVDVTTGLIWSRAHWERLHNLQEEECAAAAA
jgi:hypothetical protein